MSARSQKLIPFFLFLFGCLSVGACANHSPALTDWHPAVESIMVVMKDPRSVRNQHPVSGPGYAPRLQYSEDPALQRAAAKIAADYNVEILTQWPIRSLQVHCFVVAKPTPEVEQALAKDHRVRWLQPFNQFETKAMAANRTLSIERSAKPSMTPIARLMSEIDESGSGVRLAVIDTSFDQSHPDLARSSIIQRNFAGSRGEINKEAHGTAVVGVIAARSSKNRVSGMAHGADVRLLRGCWQRAQEPGMCNTLTLALALDAAVELAPDVLNLSLSGSKDRVLQELVELLLANGTLVVAAYDEARAHDKRFPSPAQGMIYAFGERNAAAPVRPPTDSVSIVVSAPRQVLTLAPMARYDIVSGHSIAAPQIAAAAARLMDRYPQASRQHILALLQQWLDAPGDT